jgi:integrase
MARAPCSADDWTASCPPVRTPSWRAAAGPARRRAIVRKAARRAGIGKAVTPHTLRHAFITAALDAGVPLRDVREAASHADPRTTIRHDRARGSLDRHATCIVAAYIAGAAR